MTERFVRGDGFFTDTDTDVMWKLGFESTDNRGDSYTFDEAKAKFKGFDEFAGFDDWRLPTKNECESALEYELFKSLIRLDASLKNFSRDYSSNGFWSSTVVDADCAWKVRFKDGEEKLFRNIPESFEVTKWLKSDKSGIILCRSID